MAVAKLQWGHADHSVEDTGPGIYQIRNTVLQWGHADHSVEDLPLPIARSSPLLRFNGATLITAWKTRPGPAWWPRRTRARFNGATLITAWKTNTVPVGTSFALPLQWGHADHSVEDALATETLLAYARLQWGHADHSVEDSALP